MKKRSYYVGNLNYQSTSEELRAFIRGYGFDVSRAMVCTDRDTGDSRGFAFIDIEGADDAIERLDGQVFAGRELKVRDAERKPSGRRPHPAADDLL